MRTIFIELEVSDLEEVDFLRSRLSIYDIVSIKDADGNEIEEDDVYS